MNMPTLDNDNVSNRPAGQRWIIPTALVLLLGAAVLPLVINRAVSTPAGPGVGTWTAMKMAKTGEFRGFTVQLSGDPDVPFEKYVDEIAQTGANTIMLSVAALQENCASSSIFLDQRKVPPTERVEGLIRRAHEQGMKVVFMPIVLLENPGTGEWRGKNEPRDPTHWWEQYTAFILTYAKLAQRCGVDVFMVGSELISLEYDTQRWKDLIRQVRGEFSGRLTYSANWDHYEKIEFWRDLDIVSMTSYYDLVGDKKPSLEALVDSWTKVKDEILAWQSKVGMPLMFSELAYPSQLGCAKEPWNYYASTTPDPDTQAMCFEAFFKVWRDEPAVAGVLVWEWRNYENTAYQPDKDTGYRIDGKPAMKYVQEFFGSSEKSPLKNSGTATAPGS
jgi:hypothetical protein